MFNVLGLNFGHDGSAAVLKGGRLVGAISNEQLSRKKKASGVTKEMIDYVLDMAKLKLADIHVVAFTSFFYAPDNYIKVLYDQRPLTEDLLDINGGKTIVDMVVQIEHHQFRAAFIHHHIAHAAAAYYTSPFEAAACFSLDASQIRPEACSLFAYGQGDKLHYLECPGLMIGNAYSDFTELLGLGPGLLKAGTTMALASLGKPLPLALEKWECFSRSWYERVCQDSDPVFIRKMWSELSGLPPHAMLEAKQSDSLMARDIAASIQYIFETSVVRSAQELYEQTRTYNGGNLCLSGGSFLNSNANMTIKLKTPFRKLHLFPACGDDGTAVGAAMYAAHNFMKVPRIRYELRDCMYLGMRHDIPKVGRPYNAREIARSLSDGKLVAWFCEGSEFGPRALGHRSILADPRRPEIKNIINSRVKRREWYRPFAPVVLSEKAAGWFEIDFESKLMLFIAPIRQPEKIPSVSHTDQSARLQTLERADNPALYELNEEFEAITGVPILLNTSLNANGEPLVETPQDALNFFHQTPVDLLVLEDRVLEKQVPRG